MNTKEKDYYSYPYPLDIVPKWCQLPPSVHQDGMGGCWSISYGFVESKGEDCCKKCEYYKEQK